MTIAKLTSASALALLLAGPAFSQGAVVGTDALDDQIDDISEDVADEFTRDDDPERFGRARFRPGFTGSVSLGYSGTTGNSETQDLNVAGRVRYGGQVINQTIGFALNYGESTNPDTDESFTSEEEVFVVYEANRYFTDNFYGFALGSYRNDDFDTLQDDAFLGVGAGYRIVNTPRVAWRLQAGPGVRYTQDQLGEEETEVAGIAASRFYFQFQENISLSNDTDVLFSDDAGTLVRNDFGVNFEVSERLTTRISYRTDYNSDALEGLDSTDNRLGVALVFGL